MNAYAYCAALYCEQCANRIKDDLFVNGVIAGDDSEEYPQGPFSNGGGESDCPQHCDACGEHLENSLTADGYRYVAEAIDSWPNAGSQKFLRDWADFYSGENDELDSAIERSTIFAT